MRGLPSILFLFRKEFDKFNKYRSTNVRFYLSYDIKIILKSYAICVTLKALFHNISRKSVNH